MTEFNGNSVCDFTRILWQWKIVKANLFTKEIWADFNRLMEMAKRQKRSRVRYKKVVTLTAEVRSRWRAGAGTE